MPAPAALGTIKPIAEAIREGFKLVAQILSGRAMAKMQYRIEAAMNFAHVVFGEGEHKDKGFKNLYDDATPEQKKLMIHFRKRIFDV